ncbi:uncharacterized protein BX663DRAFT_501920 [Cokeromyces recurvatus]|uniref:uncharacterized protein n=1 Tax=Cokeromyces recurvatus TaxID=90255 RepID=UPI0022210799|nr:uncharacterized protein BX663DRAFT_501920 [Cokeromyces recurvatus]KAI7905157.1 hypothetical protein BX663DRAFT_501920 [Cokeromyces recurvatus]
MPSLTEKWRQIQTGPPDVIDQTVESPISPPKSANSEMDKTTLKAFMLVESKPSPVIDVATEGSMKSKVSQNGQASTGTDTNNSIADEFHKDIDLLDTFDEHNTFEQYKEFPASFENLPMDLIFSSTNNLSLSLNRVSSIGLSSSSEFHDKWPVPETVEELYRICEKEQSKGDLNSRFALCLHLMESAWKMDPNSILVVSPDEIKLSGSSSSSSMFEDFRSGLSLSSGSQISYTLNEAMIREARKLLKQLTHSGYIACKGIESEAQYLLGNCYGMGAFGWPINHKRAFQWYFHASKNGHTEATYRAAVCYELGIGIEKDASCAIMFYRKAAHLMHVPSMYKLGIILMRGYYDQPVSKREAVIWLQRAAYTAIAPLAPGDECNATTVGSNGGVALPHALHALAIIHLTGECENTSIISDSKYAIKLLHNAARLGYAPSQYKLGECYESGVHCSEDESQSIYWYALAAHQNYPEACLALSGWYLTGSIKTDSLMQSDQEAFVWAYKAAKLSKGIQSKSLVAKSYYTLGIYYENGIGVSKSLNIAHKWYRKAAQYGHTDAIKNTFVN